MVFIGLVTIMLHLNLWNLQLPITLIIKCGASKWLGQISVALEVIPLKKFVQGGINLLRFILLREIITIIVEAKSLMRWVRRCWNRHRQTWSWDIRCWSITIRWWWAGKGLGSSSSRCSSSSRRTATTTWTPSPTPTCCWGTSCWRRRCWRRGRRHALCTSQPTTGSTCTRARCTPPAPRASKEWDCPTPSRCSSGKAVPCCGRTHNRCWAAKT